MNYSVFRSVKTISGIAVFLLAILLQVTPAAAAAVSTHLVISEVQTAGAEPNSSQEFIELYNPTSQTVFLENWSVQYKNSGDPYDLVAVAPLGVGKFIPAHGYFLLRPSTLPGADAGYGFDLNAAGGTIFLVKSTMVLNGPTDANVVDKVAYGNGDNPEQAVALAPTAGQSIDRLPGQIFSEGNAIDTNNNSADFVVRTAPQPQTAGSAAQVAVGPTVTGLTPPNGSIVASQSLTVTANVTDNSSGVDPANLLLFIDGEFHGPMAYTGTTATRIVNLGQGTHTIVLRADDLAGYTSETRWVTTVDTLAPSLGLTITDGAPKNTQLATTIRLDALDSPAGRATGVSQMRLAFDGALDTEPWEDFQAVVTRNLMNKEGLQAIVAQVRDRAGNLSNVASTTTVLDLTTSAAPAEAISSTTGTTITMTWLPVPGATSYMVRYSDGQTLFGPLTTANTFLVVVNLDPNKKYNFEVAAVNPAGTVSAFTKVVTPEVAVQIAAARKTAELPSGGPIATPTEATSTDSANTSSTFKPEPSPSPSEIAAVEPSPEVLADSDTQPRDWTRVIVALSILIIAAGVATGGWYLYQWWSTRPNGDGKGKGKGGRW